MEDIRSYDFGETEKNYNSKKQYYKAQETAAINKYDIENENPYEFSYSQSTGTSGGDESGDNADTNTETN